MGVSSYFDGPFLALHGGPVRSAPPHSFPRGLDPVPVWISLKGTTIYIKAKPRYGSLLHDAPHVSQNLRSHTLHEAFKNPLSFFTGEGFRLKSRDPRDLLFVLRILFHRFKGLSQDLYPIRRHPWGHHNRAVHGARCRGTNFVGLPGNARRRFPGERLVHLLKSREINALVSDRFPLG